MNNQILIIDDEEVVLDSCALILEGSGYPLATAGNGQLGLQRLQELRPDLVFVDLKMPGMSGFDVLMKIGELDPTAVVIVITGYATVSSAVEAMKKGAYDFLPKPFTPDEFRMVVRRGLEKRRLLLETIALRREKEMLREQFAAIVSHELKAPLGAVQQNLFVLANELAGQLTEAQSGRLERMQTNIRDLINLILTWLRVLSVDVRKIQETFRPTAVSIVIAKAMESMQPHAARKDIELVSSLPASPGLVNGDEGTLVEVLVNLLGNAIKYSRVGGRVAVKAETAGDDLLLSVTDTGVGIAKEDLPHVFDDFYRGQAGQASDQSSGLGLGIARRIVEAHDGSITVESELGAGTIFVIRLPALKTEQHP